MRSQAGSAQTSRAAAAMFGLAGPLALGVMTGHLRAGLAATLAGCFLALTLCYLGWSRLSPPVRFPVKSKIKSAPQIIGK
ncbi:MAG: hypothetical protein P8X68_21515 [Desulfobacterales bacterium]